VFVAINGRDDHGLEYVGDALDRGATTLIIDAPESLDAATLAREDVTTIIVDDARVAMAQMAIAMHGDPSRRVKLYGVTGTNGKTTTTWVLRQLLEAVGEREQ